jgi:hypothetical protein
MNAEDDVDRKKHFKSYKRERGRERREFSLTNESLFECASNVCVNGIHSW